MTAISLSVLTILLHAMAAAAEIPLPDPLISNDGTPVKTAADWSKRREELLEVFRREVFGRNPVERPAGMTATVIATRSGMMDGKAIRKQVRIAYQGPGGAGGIDLLLFIPAVHDRPVPCYLLICNRPPKNIDAERATPSPFWPAEDIVARGCAAAAFFVGDVDPDKHDGFKDGVHGIFDEPGKPRADDAWGTIAAWAWGASRCIDYLVTDPDMDAKRLAVVGHSRGGKTALWCGAQDERVSLTISNNSGCTGAALSRGKQGESVAKINASFPHWFCANYKRWNGREAEMPFDQHELIALCAPRLAYVASATEDLWADPDAEFRACVAASPAWTLHGLVGVAATVKPAPEQPVQDGRLGYHLRTGKHDLTPYDWRCYVDFGLKHWR